MKSNIKMFREVKTLLLLAALSVTVFCTTGCQNKEDEAQKPAAKLQLANSATLGKYLADGQGNTLCVLTRDVAGTNNCTGGCATTWPVFYDAALTQDLLPTGLQLARFQ